MEFKIYQDKIVLEGDNKKILAEVTFPEKNSVLTIEHTFVDESLRGQGVAANLMEQAANVIRASGKKATAKCSYAVKWFSEHPDEQDLLI